MLTIKITASSTSDFRFIEQFYTCHSLSDRSTSAQLGYLTVYNRRHYRDRTNSILQSSRCDYIQTKSFDFYRAEEAISVLILILDRILIQSDFSAKRCCNDDWNPSESMLGSSSDSQQKRSIHFISIMIQCGRTIWSRHFQFHIPDHNYRRLNCYHSRSFSFIRQEFVSDSFQIRFNQGLRCLPSKSPAKMLALSLTRSQVGNHYPAEFALHFSFIQYWKVQLLSGNHYLAEFALQISFIEDPKSSNNAGTTKTIISWNQSSPKSELLKGAKS